MTLRLIVGIISAILLVIPAASHDADLLPNPHGINGIMLWTEPDCQGIPASTIFNETNLAKNISNACLSRSFKLFRPLQGYEQLDISISQQLGSWYPYEDQLSVHSLPCTSFIQSYFPINGSNHCYNTPPFTCHRLWVNDGLPLDLRAPAASSNFVLPPSFPLITPSSCNSPSSAVASSNTIPSPTPTPPKSTTSPQISLSNQVHTVLVNTSSTLFTPRSLDNIPSGHAIQFQSNQPFQLVKTSSNNTCQLVHSGPAGVILDYNVTSQTPTWFYACAATDKVCHCNHGEYFTLNLGGLLTDILSLWVKLKPGTKTLIRDI
ncbi:hypothetical protein BDW62DRAFT_216220 [Aspergillus aurantiobrunneus]